MNARRYPWEFHGETLSLETPEQTPVEYRIAPFGTRIAAALFDRMIIALLTLALFLLTFSVLVAGSPRESIPWLLAGAVLGQFLLSVVYFALFELRGEGRTPGKRRFGLRTVMATGRGLTAGAALIRNLARLADEIPLFWVVPAVVPGNRRIGDLLAGTFVIVETAQRHARRRSWLAELAPSYRALPERRFPITAQMATRLLPDDLNLIEYLDERLRGVGPARRTALLAAIAARYGARLGLEDDRERIAADPRRFLQELGLFLRQRFEEQPV